MSRPFLKLSAILLVLHTSVFGQVLPFHTYTTKDGLLSNRILTMMQDSRGYLWIGTADGVSVFDGVTFKNYTPADGLAGSYVTSIIESKKAPGTMWIGTLDGGLCMFANGTFRKIDLGTSSTQVFSLMEDLEGTLWCGTNDLVLQVREDTVTPFHRELIPRGETGIVEGSDSLVYIASQMALFVHSNRSGVLRPIDLDLTRGVLLAGINKDTKGDVWGASTDSTVYHFRGAMLLEKRHIGTRSNYPMVFDNDDELWFGGVFRIPLNQLAGGRPIHYTTENGLPGGIVYPLLVDSEDNIWFGSWDNGLVKLAEKDIVSFPAKIHDSKNAVIADDHGRLWGLAVDGVYEYWLASDGSWHQTRHLIGPPSNPLLHGSTGAFAHGYLWIGCNDRTIKGYRVRASHPTMPSSMTLVRTISFKQRLFTEDLFGVHSDRDNNLWCVIGNTLEVVDVSGEPRVIRRIASPPLPSNAFVNSLWKDRRGNVWIGEYNLGLFLLPYGSSHDDTVMHFTTKNGLPDNSIRSITEDRDGRVWIGTRFGGLAVYEDGKFTTISTKDGLLSNHIRGMACDSTGTMWLGTSLGPMYINTRDNKRFGWNNELLGIRANACGVHAQGFLWFATSNGLTLYQHSKHRLNTNAPPVYITSFTVNGQSFDVGSPAALSYQQNNCVIGFVGISLRDESAVRYQYRLQGVDTSWGSPTSQRSVTFATLSPGTYAFEVKAINADGITSAAPAAVSFTIHPPFWQRWWFIALCVLAAAGVGYALYRYRIEKLLEVERLRTRIASDLHDDIGSGLTRIAILSDMALKQSTQDEVSADSPMRTVGFVARELHEVMTDVVWAIGPEREGSGSPLRRIKVFATEMCEGAGVALRFSADEKLDQMVLTPQVRRAVLMIGKEAITNVVRHAMCTEVLVNLGASEKFFRISVEDNGKGFATGNLPRMSGLVNMQRRAEKAGGSLKVLSTPGSGTRVEAHIPLNVY